MGQGSADATTATQAEARILVDGKYGYAPKDLEILPGLHAKVYN